MNPALKTSGKSRGQILAQGVESVLEFVKRHVERCDRVKAAVGFVGEYVSAVNGFKGDGVVKSVISTGSFTDLVKGVFKVHHVVDVGDFLVFTEEFRIDGLSIGCRESKVKQNACFLWFVEDSDTVWSEADSGDR